MSSVSAVWRDGEGNLRFVVEAGLPPVPEPFKKDARELQPEHGWLTLYCADGEWSAGMVMLEGRWLRKTDGKPGSRTGAITFTTPLSAEEGVPQWLVVRVAKLTAALSRTMRELEKEFTQ